MFPVILKRGLNMKKSSLALNETKKCIGIIFSTLLYCFGINAFLVPHNIYCGGFMGYCQVLRTLIVEFFDINPNFDIASIIYYCINIPILIFAWFKISHAYLLRTLLCLTVMTPALALIPTQALLPDDRLASCLIGGILSGAGAGFYLRMGASGGGADVIGLILIRGNKGKSIGGFNLMVNMVLYLCCIFFFDLGVLIYSVIFSVFFSIFMDKVYTQNINEEVKIITRLPGDQIGKAIMEEMGRGVTIINSKGAYTNGESRILYVVLSKYEIPYLRTIVREYDPQAFIVESGSVNVYGNYLKKLI